MSCLLSELYTKTDDSLVRSGFQQFSESLALVIIAISCQFNATSPGRNSHSESALTAVQHVIILYTFLSIFSLVLLVLLLVSGNLRDPVQLSILACLVYANCSKKIGSLSFIFTDHQFFGEKNTNLLNAKLK